MKLTDFRSPSNRRPHGFHRAQRGAVKLNRVAMPVVVRLSDIIRNIKSKRLRWTGHVARMGESRNAYRVLIGRPEGKSPLGRPRRRWENNIKMYLREMGYDDREWIGLAQDRDLWRAYVRAAMNLRVSDFLRCRVGYGLPPDLDPVDMWSFVVGGSATHSGFSTGLMDDNNALSESAMRISYKICHEIAKELKTFNEGEFIKRCLMILADELCPQQIGEVEAIRLSRRTVVRRLHRGQLIRGGPPAWGLGEGLTTHHRKKQLVTNPYNKPRNRTDSLARPQQRNKVLRFGTWNVTSLYRTGGVTLVAKELARYRIDFVGVQEVRLDGNGLSQIGDYLLYYGEGNNNHQLGTGIKE
ncbi:hypothetical protein ANN_04816 [Periplaneta americana]|uniref:Endonuclease/exonuclease/phosphatase domain-containing protein n=1 Tax=Periplaneta americana TaxID=6978 RepID=A0ABQ8TAP3_PERAM|nr:hypothetical protein ANN_04816 [Periplaneta americana]